MTGRWRQLALFSAALLALAVAIAAALWGWSGTPASLEWALRRVPASQPMVFEGLQGSLRHGLQARRLQWQQDGLSVEATGVDVAWRWRSLLRGGLWVRHLRAEQLAVTDTRPPKDTPPAPPASLALPLRVDIREFKIDRLQWNGATRFEAGALAGRYRYAASQHELRLDSAQWADGSYSGRATLGATGAMPLEARLDGRLETAVPGSTKRVPLAFGATLKGPLADLQAAARIRAEGPAAGPDAPQADATARLMPWQPQPVPQAQADLRGIDLAALWPQLPRTRLHGKLGIQPAGNEGWDATASLDNALPGPYDRGRLPIAQLRADGQWRRDGSIAVRRFDAQGAGGRLEARGDWRPSGAWKGEARARDIDPAALHTALAPVPFSGTLALQGTGPEAQFTVALKARDGASRSPPPADALGAALRALELRELDARGRWARGTLSLPSLRVATADATLQGALELRPAARAGSGQLTLEAPGLQARTEGALAPRDGRGTLRLELRDATPALAWLKRLPLLPETLRGLTASGRGELLADWQGGWADPQLTARLTVPELRLGAVATAAAAPAAWTLRETTARADGRLGDLRLQLSGQAQQGQRKLSWELAARGGRTRAGVDRWQGELGTFNLSLVDPGLSPGTWTLGLRQPLALRGEGARAVQTGAGEAVVNAPVRSGVSQAVVAWQPLRWERGELQTAGRVTGLPMAWVELVGGPQLAGSALSGDLVFDAAWDVLLADTPRLKLSLARSRGDLTVLAEGADGAAARVAAGVREASLSVETQGEAVVLALRWDSERAGSAQARLTSRLARGGAAGWEWPATAPLAGRLQAQLPRIGVWSLLAPPGWRLRGSLAADVALAGTRGEPRATGTLNADDLALRSVVDGVALQGGRLRARLEGDRLLIDEFLLRGAGADASGGTLLARGEGVWAQGKPQVNMTAQLTRLRASVRSDRELMLSGQLAGRVEPAGAEVSGSLRVDQARIVLPDESAPRLSTDVVVRNAPGQPQGAPASRLGGPAAPRTATDTRARPVRLAMAVDFGDDFRIQGRGIDTRLAGTLVLTGESLAAPRMTGTVNAVGGQYRAYGQRLNIERALLRFTGPLDNPVLDVLAIRPNLIAQRVGVLITGRAQSPFVRLYAEPELSEAEKLSWLVLGRPSASGGAEAALLQQAALAVLASRTGTGTGPGIAGRFGLDELSVRRDASEGAAITLGKRFTDNFYAAYERTLSGALGTLFVFYDLSRRLTVRAEAGERTAIDLIYTFSFD